MALSGSRNETVSESFVSSVLSLAIAFILWIWMHSAATMVKSESIRVSIFPK